MTEGGEQRAEGRGQRAEGSFFLSLRILNVKVVFIK
jgi:hypothetical protein